MPRAYGRRQCFAFGSHAQCFADSSSSPDTSLVQGLYPKRLGNSGALGVSAGLLDRAGSGGELKSRDLPFKAEDGEDDVAHALERLNIGSREDPIGAPGAEDESLVSTQGVVIRPAPAKTKHALGDSGRRNRGGQGRGIPRRALEERDANGNVHTDAFDATAHVSALFQKSTSKHDSEDTKRTTIAGTRRKLHKLKSTSTSTSTSPTTIPPEATTLKLEPAQERKPAAMSTTTSVSPSKADLSPPTPLTLPARPRARPSRQPPLPANIPTHDEPPPSCPHLTAHVAPLLRLCTNQDQPISFSTYASSLSSQLRIEKIAEASYGEVYRLTPCDTVLVDSIASTPSKANRRANSVLKVVALKPLPLRPFSSRGQSQSARSKTAYTKAQQERIASMTSVQDMAGEIRLLQRMSPIPGFADLRSAHLLQGVLPPVFVQAWREWQNEERVSEFPDPETDSGRKQGGLGEEQLWAVVEMVDAGGDLEDKPIKDIFTLWDVFWGVAISLAKGEAEAEFEHRDLHLGNICIQYPQHSSSQLEDPSPKSTRTNHNRKRKSTLRRIDTTKNLNYTGLETTLIDYTLSRARMTSSTSIHPASPRDLEAKSTARASASKAGTHIEADVAYLDLSAPEHKALFEADASEEYQYDIYRFMRSAVTHGEPLYPCPSSSAAAPSTSSVSARGSTRNASIVAGGASSVIARGKRSENGCRKVPLPRQEKQQLEKKQHDKNEGEDQDGVCSWERHTPLTNLVWLHFVLHKLIAQLAPDAAASFHSTTSTSVDDAAECLGASTKTQSTTNTRTASTQRHRSRKQKLNEDKSPQDDAWERAEQTLQSSLNHKVSELQQLLRLEQLGARSRGWYRVFSPSSSSSSSSPAGRGETGEVAEVCRDGVEGAQGAAALVEWALVEKFWLGWDDVLG